MTEFERWFPTLQGVVDMNDSELNHERLFPSSRTKDEEKNHHDKAKLTPLHLDFKNTFQIQSHVYIFFKTIKWQMIFEN